MNKPLGLAALAYSSGDTALADAALTVARRGPPSPRKRKALLLATLSKGGGVQPPPGFVFLVDIDGAYLTDRDGAYLMEAA